ncbi:helix-turn-helix domain-containing protein [uncultured Aquimarina sp.]|uniref:helix-turn-helix domain-containing protein n=1 Tax=uncultured Aquimarina sp. TaxID=575652 RepID=UPI00260F09FD|nr:helix-turn-helix domain-containing protein [uncultured Aquimarina sp.]
MDTNEAKGIINTSKKFDFIGSDVFDHLINEIDNLDDAKLNSNDETLSFDISIEIINSIVVKLNKFEEGNDFLKPNITLTLLAKDLNTNSKYLSKIINTYKQKTFTQYINDLRIDYLIEKLKTNTSYTKYSIKAIAEEIGFKTPNAFSRAFFKKIGKYPSEYIKEL